MKKLLVILIPVLVAGTAANAQSLQGYYWYFNNAAPFTSVPGAAGSAVSYTLSTVGTGTITPQISSDLSGLGSMSCPGANGVAQFTIGSELVFSNDPQIVFDSYTIEMIVNFSDYNGYVKLLGFSEIPASDESGFYTGTLDYATAGVIGTFDNSVLSWLPTKLYKNQWYDIVITRDGATKDISIYVNGVLLGVAFNDSGDVLIPRASNNNQITILYNNLPVEYGMIGKVSIFNKALKPVQVLTLYNEACNSGLILLPVALKNFNAQKAGGKVNLSWTTATEQNNKGFEVQRSTDGTNYTAIGFVNGAGNSSADIAYHFTDASPLGGKSYYRLKQINIDNQFKLSVTRLIDFAKDVQDLQVYPNPTHSILTVVNLKAGNALRIFDSFGRFVYGKNITDTEETIPVDKLAAGVYVLQVTDSNGNKRSIRFTRF